MRYIKLDEKWLNKLRETAHFFSADIVCGAGTDWVLKTAEAENKTLFDIISYLENALSEDVAEVRHGRWIDEDFPLEQATENSVVICSVCGETAHKAEHDYSILSDYCPYCGAKMDGESETETTQEAVWQLKRGG